jgi:hypothetical protein
MFAKKVLLFALALLCYGASVHAHFLFTRITPHAEAGRGVDVFFSEYATAGDPKFVEKIAGTKLWLQATPGKFQPLSVERGYDRLRAHLPPDGAASVVGRCDYGVLTRKVSFLLQYFPKAVAGDAKSLNELKPYGDVPLEILATFENDRIVFTALRDGKPLPEAEFITVDEDLFNEKLKADGEGRATWKPEYPGYFCVYTTVTLPESGTHADKAYSEIRRFATLSFPWPLVRTDPDEEAVALFERAIASRATWHEFSGYSANLEGTFDGRSFKGQVRAGSDGSVDVAADDKTAAAWVDDQLGSIVLHRASSGRREKPVLYFADHDEGHPLGRLLTFVGGRFASSYRVKDEQIMVVNRHLGGENMTITVLENQKNAEGKYLPRVYTVQYWDAKDGRLLRTETIQDAFERIGKWDLPTSHTVSTASSAGLSVRTFRLSKHETGTK